MLPDIDGFQILQKIRDKSNIPVLMLTAKSSEEDKVFGLRLGADDYLTKPFGINELLARVNSLIRRYTTLNPFTADIDSISLKDMVIDKLNRTVTVKDIPVLLTGKEFDLLLFLASNKGRVFTKKQIYSQVWEEEYAFDDSNIMSFISKLRKKIEPDPDHLQQPERWHLQMESQPHWEQYLPRFCLPFPVVRYSWVPTLISEMPRTLW